MAPSTLAAGTLLAGRFEIGREIGSGANSHVYRCRDQRHNDRLVAVKIEHVLPANRQLLTTEADVLRELRGVLGIPRMVAFVEGDKAAGGSFLAMELLGEDVRKISVQARRFSARAVAFLGIQMLAALQGVHERGLVHRDVKPGNFAFGRRKEEKLKVYLIDFGLVRRHLDNGIPRRARSKTPFRGTTHYASMAAMLGKDLGRVDDLWSLAFSLLEMSVGHLPWDKLYRKGLPRDQKERAKRRVLEEKKRLVAAVAHSDPEAIEALRPCARFLRHVPRELQDFMRELLPLRYDSRPEYARMRDLLMAVGSSEECRDAAEREVSAARERVAVRRAQEADVQRILAEEKGLKPPPAELSRGSAEESERERPDEESEQPARKKRCFAARDPDAAPRPEASKAREEPAAEGRGGNEEVAGAPGDDARLSEVPLSEEVQDNEPGELDRARAAQPLGEGGDGARDEEEDDEAQEAARAEEEGASEASGGASADESGGVSGEDTKDEAGDYDDEDSEGHKQDPEAASSVQQRVQPAVPAALEEGAELQGAAAAPEAEPTAEPTAEPQQAAAPEESPGEAPAGAGGGAPEAAPGEGEASAEPQHDAEVEDAAAEGEPQPAPETEDVPAEAEANAEPQQGSEAEDAPAEAEASAEQQQQQQQQQQPASEAEEEEEEEEGEHAAGSPGAEGPQEEAAAAAEGAAAEGDAGSQPQAEPAAAAEDEQEEPAAASPGAEGPQEAAPAEGAPAEGDAASQPQAEAAAAAEDEPAEAPAAAQGAQEDAEAEAEASPPAEAEASPAAQGAAGDAEEAQDAAWDRLAREGDDAEEEASPPGPDGAPADAADGGGPPLPEHGEDPEGDANVETEQAAPAEDAPDAAPDGPPCPEPGNDPEGDADMDAEQTAPAEAAPPSPKRLRPRLRSDTVAVAQDLPPLAVTERPRRAVGAQARVLRIVRKTVKEAGCLDIVPFDAGSGGRDAVPAGNRKRPPPRPTPSSDGVGFATCGDGDGQPPRLLRARLDFVDEEPPMPLEPPWQRVGCSGGQTVHMAFVGPPPPPVRTGVGPGGG